MAYDLTPASSHSISYGDADAYSPGVNTISIVLRAYVDDFSPACGFVNKRNAHNSNDEYSAGINYTGAGRWELQIGNAAGTAVGAAYYGARTEAAGSWYHVVMVYNGGASAGSRCQIYIDGVAKSITSVTDANVTPGNTGSSLVLGRVNNTGSFYFDGRLADVALYNVALTSDEALALSEGYAPPMVRGRSLFFYDGLRSTPRDAINGIAGTTSASYIDHPRVVLPAQSLIYRKVASVGGDTLIELVAASFGFSSKNIQPTFNLPLASSSLNFTGNDIQNTTEVNLSSGSLNFTPNDITTSSGTIIELTKAAFNFTANAITTIADTVITLTTAAFNFSAKNIVVTGLTSVASRARGMMMVLASKLRGRR